MSKNPNCLVCKKPVTLYRKRANKFHHECYLYWRTLEPSNLGYSILKYLKKYRATPGVIQKELPFNRSAIQKATRKLLELGYIEKIDQLYCITKAGIEKLKYNKR